MNESNNDLSNPLLNLTERTAAGVSPLEQEVLDEYTRLLNNMNHVRRRCHNFCFCHFSPCQTEQLPRSDPLAAFFLTCPQTHTQLSETLAVLSKGPITIEIAEGLRLLERKVASVYTLMKASVYSIVLQQGQLDGDEDVTGMTTGHGDETVTQ